MMLEKTGLEYIDVLSSKEPVPGGGGASAFVGAQAAALGLMVGNLTVGKKKYRDVEEDIKASMERLIKYQKELEDLVDQDAEAFYPLSQAYGLPKNTEEEKAHKAKVMEEALYSASLVPLRIMEVTLDVMKELKLLGEKGSRMVTSDVGVGILFAEGALEGASLNIIINVKSMKNAEHAETLKKKYEALIKEGKEIKEEVYRDVLEKIS